MAFIQCSTLVFYIKNFFLKSLEEDECPRGHSGGHGIHVLLRPRHIDMFVLIMLVIHNIGLLENIDGKPSVYESPCSRAL